MEDNIKNLDEQLELLERQRKEEVTQAKELLEKKYHMKVTIFRLWRQNPMDPEYWVEASEDGKEEERFWAVCSKDGTYMRDQYKSCLLAKKIEETLKNTWEKSFEIFHIKAGLADKWMKNQEPGKAGVEKEVAGYDLKKESIYGLLYLDILEEKSKDKHYSGEEIYEALLMGMKAMPEFSGQIRVSVEDVKTFSELLVYFHEHANINNTYHSIKENEKEILAAADRGSLKKMKNQFCTEWKGGN